MTALAWPGFQFSGWRSAQAGLGGIEYQNDLELAAPGPDEIVIRVGACGVNFSDILMLQDRYQVRPDRPFVPGQEIAGWVVTAGEGTNFGIGDYVAGEVRTGGFAEYAILPGTAAIRIPDALDVAKAAAIPVVYATAVMALTESTQLKPGETILVHAAAGGVGLASVQIAKSLGATVIAAASTEAKRNRALENGADHVIDYTQQDWRDGVSRLTDGRGADVVVDTVGGDTTLESLRCLARGGRLLIVGFASGVIPEIAANRLLLKRASAIGVYWSQLDDKEIWSRIKQRLSTLITRGAINPVIDTRFPIAALPSALSELEQRRVEGKLVLRFDEDGRPS